MILFAMQIAAVCGLRLGSESDVPPPQPDGPLSQLWALNRTRSESRTPCRSTASPFQGGIITQNYKGQDLFIGRFEQPAKYADRPGERSPNRIKVGCDAIGSPNLGGHMCTFFASTFIRSVFPSSDIEIIPGPSGRSHEADISFVHEMSSIEGLCMPERRVQEILSPSNHSPGWTNGVHWPLHGNVSLHKEKRPFCVCQEYEPHPNTFVPFQCDLFITHFSNFLFEGPPSLQPPIMRMPESYRDMGLRWLNVPEDVTFDRASDTARQPFSTICKTNRLSKDLFMAFMHGECWKAHYDTADFLLRISLFDELAEKYKAPTALGQCRMRVDGERLSYSIVSDKMTEYNLSQGSGTFADEAVLAWEPFKFAVVFQNTHEAGAVQEKIVHAWLARSVPVYFGPPDALTDYNPESFINCGFSDLDSKLEQINTLRRKFEDQIRRDPEFTKKFGERPPELDEFDETSPEFKQIINFTRETFANDFQKCLQKIKAVDQDEKAWLRMVHTPVFKGNSIKRTVFDMEEYARRFREVLEAASSAVISAQ